jgi:hypothetical protein
MSAEESAQAVHEHIKPMTTREISQIWPKCCIVNGWVKFMFLLTSDYLTVFRMSQHVASTLIENAAPMPVDVIAAVAPMALAPMTTYAAPKAVDCIAWLVNAVQGAAEAVEYSTEAAQRTAEHTTPKPVVIQKRDGPCGFDSFLLGR